MQLPENGLFIGPFPNATYTNMSVPFQTGDRLLLYTDGIVEASGPDGEEFGRERLEQFLVGGAKHAPTEFIDALFPKNFTRRTAGRFDRGRAAVWLTQLSGGQISSLAMMSCLTAPGFRASS